MQSDNNYPASDLAEIVYLLCKGKVLNHTERHGQRVIFCFSGLDECRHLVADIGYGRDLVNLSAALEQIRRARHLMHHT